MNLDDSKQVLKAAFEASDILNQSLQSLKAGMADDEYGELCESFGKVLGEIYFELIAPAFNQHPTLEPGPTAAAWIALAKEVGARKNGQV